MKSRVLKYRIALILTGLMMIPSVIMGDDYQFQYFSDPKSKEKYVPFSDYIPRIRMHNYTHPHFLEDYYQLYGMKLHYRENSLRRNIRMLKTALNCKFRHPANALVKVDTEKEYLKYRKIMFMHINLLIMRNHMKIAVRYDKRKIYFYDQTFAKEISESLKIADRYYRQALPYWEEAKRLAEEASRIKITTRMSNIESERFRIINGETDFERIINRHIKKIGQKQSKLQNYLASAK